MSTFPYFTSTFTALGIIFWQHCGLAGGVADYLKKDDAWFASAEGGRIAANILSFQSDSGGWPKNTDTAGAPFAGKKEDLKPTFDNGATTDELRFLARSFRSTGLEAERAAFTKGLSHILNAQYSNGGWPQFHPPGKGYHRHITFNDGAMVRLLEFLREVHTAETYSFVPASDREAAGVAFENGVSCILKCQIKVDGKPTVWCAQHDEFDYQPRPARAFEPASFSGSESVGITRLLMSIDTPTPEIVTAVVGAVAWFEKTKLTGIRLVKRPDPHAAEGENLVVVTDPDAPPLWVRFYDLKTQKPVFCDRDGAPKSSLAEIGHERRNSYAWYGRWGEDLLGTDYLVWKRRCRQ